LDSDKDAEEGKDNSQNPNNNVDFVTVVKSIWRYWGHVGTEVLRFAELARLAISLLAFGTREENWKPFGVYLYEILFGDMTKFNRQSHVNPGYRAVGIEV